MHDSITLTGTIGTEPEHRVISGGVELTTFRLATGGRRFDRQTQQWVDAEANWYTVSAFRRLAVNASRSLSRGDHVVVAGKLKVRSWEAGDRKGIAVDVEADSIGHDLRWVRTTAERPAPRPAGSDAPAAPGTAPETPIPTSAEEASDADGFLPADDWARPLTAEAGSLAGG
ncbi:single-stranded DNA-binding protein [Agromyces rhizosphaerae]|uniref:Single-stranded DNA-binding protein n=1 Tax=Agromyces rhizosphaerae TaxID=88374 RepID=A0A9W6FSZ0_9MICO|nr:single-stranded DNA-binding protein [Agromyces rhizosphaerae]GLI28713.1 single-stranded DNA-binding protein [Agromyces rhizosphaerae]